MRRALTEKILKDLDTKMVILTGPRQVGKTWLALNIAGLFANSVCLNYDHYHDREIIENMRWLPDHDLIVFDELHKKPDWKNFLKGVYDTKPEHQRILVTGSARLDIFRQMGDSLAGRFFLHHLMPFTPGEAVKPLNHFLNRGGFPEPFLAEDDVEASRWRMQYTDSLMRVDAPDLGRIQDLRAIQLVLEMLRHRVGSPLSFRAIAEDVHIAPNTVRKYIEVMEALFIVFLVRPHSRNIARSLLREPKVYFFDTGMVQGDDGARLENLVAVSLYKHVLGRRDYLGEDAVLRYLRTKDGLEVDFCLVKDNLPEQMIEVKVSESTPQKPLIKFNARYGIPGIQLVQHLRREQARGTLRLCRAADYLTRLDFA